MTYYDCPVCGYDRLTKPPANSYICPCCATEFDSDDFDRSYPELRGEWIERGLPWFSRSTLQPKNWDGYRQLIIADYGSDLTSHPRFKSDINYRYAVNRAFSEVRIAKQLKVTREIRKEPLTQLQLAEKAGMKQSRISELEGMNYSSWSISTLERLAEALGVGFKYSWVEWGELVPEIEGGLSREKLWVRPFEEEPAFASSGLVEVGGNKSGFRTTIARMFLLPTAQRQPAPVVPIRDPKKGQQDAGNELTTRAGQLTRAAELSSDMENEPRRRRLG